MEDMEEFFYSGWVRLSTAEVEHLRYEYAKDLRTGRAAFPDYVYRMVKVAQRVLAERGA